MGAELTHHLGYPPGAKPEAATNYRNGTTPKTVLTDEGTVALDVPRDRAGTFEPVLIPKHERHFTVRPVTQTADVAVKSASTSRRPAEADGCVS